MAVTDFISGIRSKYEVLNDLERNALDTQYLRMIKENNEIYNSFKDMFSQLKGSTGDRVSIINQVIRYVRSNLK